MTAIEEEILYECLSALNEVDGAGCPHSRHCGCDHCCAYAEASRLATVHQQLFKRLTLMHELRASIARVRERRKCAEVGGAVVPFERGE
jgi:hypothetical protein